MLCDGEHAAHGFVERPLQQLGRLDGNLANAWHFRPRTTVGKPRHTTYFHDTGKCISCGVIVFGDGPFQRLRTATKLRHCHAEKAPNPAWLRTRITPGQMERKDSTKSVSVVLINMDTAACRTITTQPMSLQLGRPAASLRTRRASTRAIESLSSRAAESSGIELETKSVITGPWHAKEGGEQSVGGVPQTTGSHFDAELS